MADVGIPPPLSFSACLPHAVPARSRLPTPLQNALRAKEQQTGGAQLYSSETIVLPPTDELIYSNQDPATHQERPIDLSDFDARVLAVLPHHEARPPSRLSPSLAPWPLAPLCAHDASPLADSQFVRPYPFS